MYYRRFNDKAKSREEEEISCGLVHVSVATLPTPWQRKKSDYWVFKNSQEHYWLTTERRCDAEFGLDITLSVMKFTRPSKAGSK